MPVDPSNLTRLASAGTAVDAHRRAQAEAAAWDDILRQRDLASANRLAELLPARPAETGALVHQHTLAAFNARKARQTLATFAGTADADLPWDEWAVELRLRVERAEEQWVVKLDELEHADTYEKDARSAEWEAFQAQAEAETYQAALADVEAHAKGLAGEKAAKK